MATFVCHAIIKICLPSSFKSCSVSVYMWGKWLLGKNWLVIPCSISSKMTACLVVCLLPWPPSQVCRGWYNSQPTPSRSWCCKLVYWISREHNKERVWCIRERERERVGPPHGLESLNRGNIGASHFLRLSSLEMYGTLLSLEGLSLSLLYSEISLHTSAITLTWYNILHAWLV